MIPARRFTAMLAAAAALGALAGAPASAAVDVSVSRDQVATGIGRGFDLESTVTNAGTATRAGLIAHLDVVSLTPDVYVDPEDWSPQRSMFLPPLRAGDSVRTRWRVEPVNAGHFAVYVVVVPGPGAPTAPQRLAVSSAVDLRVAERRTINAGGVLPLAIGMPATLGLLALGLRARRRRR